MHDRHAAEARRLRVLQITRNLPPLRGGMERLNLRMAHELALEFDLALIGPYGCGTESPSNAQIAEIPAKPLWRFFLSAASKAISTANKFKPDAVLAGSGLAAPFAWLAAKMASARMIVYVHGLDLIASHPIYRMAWCPAIRRADLCIANSRNTARLAAGMGVPQSRIIIVHPGVDIPERPTRANNFRARFELGDRPVLLSVGRLVLRKGLQEFVENALSHIVARLPNACLVVLGDEAPNTLHGRCGGLRDRIQERAACLGLADNVRFIGPQDDTTLADAYEAADVHVFPVREVAGDVEGFGMVAAEAAAHGLCSVAFAVGGVPDAIGDGISGRLIMAGDYMQFAASVVEAIENRGDAGLREKARSFAERFRWEHFGDQIRQHLRQSVRAQAS